MRVRVNLKEHLPHQIITLANQLSRQATARYSRQYSLSFAEWRLLAVVGVLQPVSGVTASRELGVDKAMVSRLSASLIARGILVALPFPGDGRRLSLVLTRKGAALHDKVGELAEERSRRLVACMTDAERATFNRVIGRLHAIIGRELKENTED